MFTSSVEHFNLSRSLIGLHTLLQLWDLTFTRYWLISLMYSKIFVPVVMTSTVISLYHLPPNFLLLYDFLNSENSKMVWIMYVYRNIFASFLFTFIIILFVYCFFFTLNNNVFLRKTIKFTELFLLSNITFFCKCFVFNFLK